jgi:hypothetical protein
VSETVTVLTVLTSCRATLDFLSRHPDPDETIRWTCPECNAVNGEAYHSHVTRCGSCGKGHFPAIPLPIVGDAKTSVKRAFMQDRLTQIGDNIFDANNEIRDLQSQIDDQERYIRSLKKERDDLKHALHLDATHGTEMGDV